MNSSSADSNGRRAAGNGQSPRCRSQPSAGGQQQSRQQGDWNGVRGVAHVLARCLLAGRAWLLAIGHLACFALIYFLAFSVRFEFNLRPQQWELVLQSLPWVVAVKAGVFYLLGHYRGWWRYVTFADLVALLRAATLSTLTILACGYFVLQLHIPRSVLILDFAFTIMLMGSLRSSFRIFREHLAPSTKPRNCRWALLVGTDDDSGILAHQINCNPHLPFRIRGLLQVDGNPQQRQLGQIPVLGHVDRVAQIAAAHPATDVLVTAGVLPGTRLRQLMEQCQDHHLTLNIIPPLRERINGNRQIPIRHIEINDLLGRDPVDLDCQAIAALIEGRVVLVTGAGGSIGSEICRQVLKFSPQKLVLVGRGENRVFAIERELSRQRARVNGRQSHTHNRRSSGPESRPPNLPSPPSPTLHAVIGDVTDAARMSEVFDEFEPHIVFHAAAHKHVPLMEDNPCEAVKNNVLGTQIVADLAHQHSVANFVLISTDKAVRPTSVMGTTKHLAERYVMALSQESATRFVVTRFGNVLGSAGSVVPIFHEQILRGGPITVTDTRMTRYFMTIPEASQLVLQATAIGRGGEIFVLDMGEPVRIVDLARDMIQLAGLAGDAIDIVAVGIRPGEKLYEELYFEDEETLETSHPKLRAAYHRPCTFDEARDHLAQLVEMAQRRNGCIVAKLRELVPEYTPACSDCHQCPKHQAKPARPPAALRPALEC